MKFDCLSSQQPYTEFLLNAVKTLETWCRPVLLQTMQCTPAMHIRHLQWEDMSSQELLEQRLGINPTQTQALLWDGDQFGHGVITGK